MKLELTRSMKGLKLKGHPSPFYLSYLLRIRAGHTTWARYGSVFYSCPLDNSTMHVDLRVGSYQSDQTVDGRLESHDEEEDWHEWNEGPEDLDPFALRYCFWRLTEERHLQALRDYYDKKKISLDERLIKNAPSLRKGKAIKLAIPLKKLHGTAKQADDFVRKTSEFFLAYPRMETPYVQMTEVIQTRLFVNSEGTSVMAQEPFFEVYLYGAMLAPDGVRQSSSRSFYARSWDELPAAGELVAVIDALHEDLLELIEAEPMAPYSGPALFGGIPSGVLFHEAIGHRLEGERLLSRSEGQTFAGRVGKRILPAGIDIVDDPSMARFEGQTLYGHYSVDDEGTPAQRVHLVEDGILRRFLTSRNGIPGQSASNGHGRTSKGREAMARMANLIVSAREPLGAAELKERWMAEVDGQERSFGLLVTDARSGETTTSSDAYEFQAFQINPTAIYKVDATSGKRRRVRDVSFVGTPLAAIQGVLALGDDPRVDNSYCFAESGSVPVGTISPSTLLRDIEVQRSTRAHRQPPIIKLPPRG
ncbi:MAG: TldD/PmbA family protein [bacterium]